MWTGKCSAEFINSVEFPLSALIPEVFVKWEPENEFLLAGKKVL